MNIGKTVLKLIAILIFIGGVYYFPRSLEPARSETQKVFDDSVLELTNSSTELLGERYPSSANINPAIKPTVKIEITINQGMMLANIIDWSDLATLKKSIRILDLLKMANVFSLSKQSNCQDCDLIIRVHGASGYKFESFLSSNQLEKNPPLKVALVLMKE